MSMKRALLIAAVLLSSFHIYAQTELTPIEFNDQLTSITDSLYARGKDWGNHFNEANQTKDFKSLRPYREDMVRFINSSISRITSMKDVNNSKPLRMAMIGFLRFELTMATNAFQPLERFNASSSKANVTKAIKHISDLAKGENAQLAKVAAAQEQYAKENNFRIESAEEVNARENKQ